MNTAQALDVAAARIGAPARVVSRRGGAHHVYVGPVTRAGHVPAGRRPVCGQRTRRLTAHPPVSDLVHQLRTHRKADPCLCKRCVRTLARYPVPAPGALRIPTSSTDVERTAGQLRSLWAAAAAHEEQHAVLSAHLTCGQFAAVGQHFTEKHPTIPDPACCPPVKKPRESLAYTAHGHVVWVNHAVPVGTLSEAFQAQRDSYGDRRRRR